MSPESKSRTAKIARSPRLRYTRLRGALGEAEIEMVRRHVCEGEEHVTRQRDIVARLPPSGDLAEIARALLPEVEESLEAHRTRLARLLA